MLEPGYRVIGVGELQLGGRAEKDFVVFPTERTHAHAYVAKRPTRVHAGPRECVTEFLIAEIGRLLPLKIARGRLVRLSASPPDVRFMSRYFLGPGEALVHGVELVARGFQVDVGTIATEVRSKEEERQLYTYDLVDDILGQVAGSVATHTALREAFARMTAFDALIGANDRHAQNWGVIEDPLGKRPLRFAPIFDTARGLFLHYSDAQLMEAGREGRYQFITQYAQKSRPLIGAQGVRGATHFDVIEAMLSEPDDPFGPAIRHVVNGFSERKTQRMLRCNFRRLMSRLRLGFVFELLQHRHGVLKNLCRRS